MAMVYSLKLDSGVTGLVCPRICTIYPKLPSHVYYLNWRRFKSHNGMQVPFRRVLGCPNLKVQHIVGEKYTVPAVGNRYHLTVEDDYDQEPFWSNLMKESLRTMKSLVSFLVEQPNQLKHIEWPSFQSTLKTAILSLILVGLLIVALASVDSALCYMLSLLLRKRV